MLNTKGVKILTLEQSAGKINDIAYILGVYLGDGYAKRNRFSRSYDFILNTIDDDFAESVIKSLKEITQKEPRHRKYQPKGNRRLVNRIEVCSKELVLFLQEKTLRKLIIPTELFYSSEETKRYFIAGIMDSDGWISKNIKKTGFVDYQLGIAKGLPWIKDLPRFFKEFGLECGELNNIKVKRDNKPIVRLLINKVSWIKKKCFFTISRKQNRMLEYKNRLSPQRLYAEHIM